jgi:lysophospholipase L1-like esterase
MCRIDYSWHTDDDAICGKEAVMIRLIGSLMATLAILIGAQAYAAFQWDRLYTHLCYLIFDALYFAVSFHLLLLAFCLVRKQPTKWQAALGRGFLLLGTSLFLLATVDVYIIAFRYDTSGLGGIHCFTHHNWYKRYARHNQLGYWERDLTPYLDERRPKGELLIAAVGDSWTWGQGIRGAQYRFGDVLEAELKGKTPQPVTVLNFGRGGADTNQEREMLDDAAKVRPDFVLICYLANDIAPYATNMTPHHVEVSPLERRLTLLSPTANFLYWRVRAPHLDHDLGRQWSEAICAAYADPSIMGKHLADVESLIARVREIKAKPIFVIMPYPSMWLEDAAAANRSGLSKRQLRNQTYEALTKKVQSLNVPVIAAYCIEDEMTLRDFALNPMDAHPNEAANRRMAETMRDEILKQGLLQKDAARGNH